MDGADHDHGDGDDECACAEQGQEPDLPFAQQPILACVQYSKQEFIYSRAKKEYYSICEYNNKCELLRQIVIPVKNKF